MGKPFDASYTRGKPRPPSISKEEEIYRYFLRKEGEVKIEAQYEGCPETHLLCHETSTFIVDRRRTENPLVPHVSYPLRILYWCDVFPGAYENTVPFDFHAYWRRGPSSDWNHWFSLGRYTTNSFGDPLGFNRH